MSATIAILDPVAPSGSAGRGHAFRRLDTLKGKVVGFIDNSKPNFNHLADDLAELLIGRHGVAEVVRHRKFSAATPAPEAVIADVRHRCDLVITGSAD